MFSLAAEVERRMRTYSFVDDNGLRAHVADALELALRDHCLFVGSPAYVYRTQMRYTPQAVLEAEQFMRDQADTTNGRAVSARVIRRYLRKVEDRAGIAWARTRSRWWSISSPLGRGSRLRWGRRVRGRRPPHW